MPALGGLRTTFHNSIAAAMQGGQGLTAAKDAARLAMDDAQRQVAAYVQSIASKDLTMLLSSGFQPMSINRTSVPLNTPNIVSIDNSATEKFTVRLTPVSNAAAYQIRYVPASTPNAQPVTVESTSSRAVLVPDLTPGTVYSLQVRGIGGSTGYSEWSNPMTCMAT
jgi:Fibronectin type III domain